MRTKLILPMAMAAFALPASAQDQERVFTPGEVVRVRADETWKILQCRPEKVSREIECEFVVWKNGGAASIRNWLAARWIAEAEARVKEQEELAAMADPPAAPAPVPATPAVPAATAPVPATPAVPQ
ncbi:MAG: hypothetical protein WDN24_01810 [Sphingomonas sp.]